MRNHYLHISVLFFWLLGGCATWDAPGEFTVIRSEPPNAQIRENGKFLGVTPSIIYVPRGYESRKYTLSLGGDTQELEIKRHYKWGKSFGRNFIFMSLAPVGWLTDLISQAAWRPDPGGSVTFKAREEKDNSKKIPKKGAVIAIAPPRSTHPDISDVMAAYIEKEMQKKYPQYSFLSYHSTVSTFADFSVDYDDDPRNEDLPNLYGRLGTNKIVISNLEIEHDKVRALINVKDFLDPASDFSTEIALPKESAEIVKKHDWVGVKPKYFYWLPNSVFLDFGESATSLTTITGTQEEIIRASSYHSDDFIGQVSRLVSTIGIRRIILPSQRDEWRYRFRLVPTASFSYAKETFPTGPTPVRQIIFTRTHADVGWGPSFNYENYRWNFYINVLPVLTYDSIATANATHEFEFSDVGVGGGAELGVMYFFKSGWTIRLYSRSANIPIDLWAKLWPEVTGTSQRIASSSFVSSGIAIGYVIPNKDLPF